MSSRMSFSLASKGIVDVGWFGEKREYAIIHGEDSVCIWNRISSARHTKLHISSCGTVNAHVYSGDIPNAYVRSYAVVMGNDFLLHGDNTRPHKTYNVKIIFGTKQFHPTEWPAPSMSLNPMEHVWNALEKSFDTLNPPPQTLATLTTTFKSNGSLFPVNLSIA